MNFDINKILHPDLKDAEVKKEAFVVDTIEKVDWAVGKVALAQQRITDRNELVKRYKAKLDDWLLGQNKPDNDIMESMKVLTYNFAVEEVAKEKKKKSFNVPNGTVGFRAGSTVVEIQDEKVAIAYCKKNAPSAIKESLVKVELKKLEVGAGFTLVTNPETYYIKPNTGLVPK